MLPLCSEYHIHHALVWLPVSWLCCCVIQRFTVQCWCGGYRTPKEQPLLELSFPRSVSDLRNNASSGRLTYGHALGFCCQKDLYTTFQNLCLTCYFIYSAFRKSVEKMLTEGSSVMLIDKNAVFLTLMSFFKQFFWARDTRHAFNLFIWAGDQPEHRTTCCIWPTLTQPLGAVMGGVKVQ